MGDEMGGTCITHREDENFIKNLSYIKPEGKAVLG
jgi:hypothetical protein